MIAMGTRNPFEKPNTTRTFPLTGFPAILSIDTAGKDIENAKCKKKKQLGQLVAAIHFILARSGSSNVLFLSVSIFHGHP